MANVVSVNISERKGEQKHPVPEIQLKLRHGIVGDAHAGDWHRQISLLAEESVDTMRANCPIPLDAGVFAENINTVGIDLKYLPVPVPGVGVPHDAVPELQLNFRNRVLLFAFSFTDIHRNHACQWSHSLIW